MPRDANGNFTLPAGNPVVTGTTIETAWANPTMEDIKQALTDSLDRYGRGGMQAPFRFVDGTNSAPGMSWASELSTGFYRAGAADMRATVAGVPQMRWTSNGVDVWDSVAAAWKPLTTAAGSNFALLNAQNKFTQQQVIQNTSAVLSLWKDATPTLGARFAFNIGQADGFDLSRFNGTDWQPKMVANATLTQFLNDQFDFYTASGSTLLGRIESNLVSFGNGAAVAPFGATQVLGIAQIGVGNSQLVAFVNDANSNPRTSLFAFGDGSTAIVGIDWNADFIAPISGFEFRRANVPIARYTANSLETLGGARMGVRSPNNATNSWWQQDNLSVSYWNTDSSVTGYQWYLNNALLMSLQGSLASGGLLLFSKGAALHYWDPAYAFGGVFVSTSAAPASGGTPGQVWLQVDV